MIWIHLEYGHILISISFWKSIGWKSKETRSAAYTCRCSSGRIRDLGCRQPSSFSSHFICLFSYNLDYIWWKNTCWKSNDNYQISHHHGRYTPNYKYWKFFSRYSPILCPLHNAINKEQHEKHLYNQSNRYDKIRFSKHVPPQSVESACVSAILNIFCKQGIAWGTPLLAKWSINHTHTKAMLQIITYVCGSRGRNLCAKNSKGRLY